MRKFLLLLILVLASAGINGQNVLGYSSKEVKSYFKGNHPDLVMDSNFTNDHYTYIKYVDSQTSLTTILVFMSNKDKCYSVKAIFDLSLEDKVRQDLNSKYRNISSSLWMDDTRGKKAKVEYIKEDWFITVSYKPV